MKGRKPTPTAVKQLRGSARPSRTRVDEPHPAAPDDIFDTPPDLITGDPIASAEWQRLAPVLRDARICTEADRGVLLACTIQWSLFVRASAIAERDELVTKRGTGALGISPHQTIAHRALTTLLKLWVELGLTPSSRTRIGEVAPPTADDPFAEFDEPLPRGPVTATRRH